MLEIIDVDLTERWYLEADVDAIYSVTFSSHICLYDVLLWSALIALMFLFTFLIINLHWPFSPPHITVWPAVFWVVWRWVSMGTASTLFRFCRLSVCVIKGGRFWMKYSWVLWQSGGVSGFFFLIFTVILVSVWLVTLETVNHQESFLKGPIWKGKFCMSHLHLHLVIWQTLLSKATYNWGIHKAIHLEEAIRQRKCS